jgi:hypothetical protein
LCYDVHPNLYTINVHSTIYFVKLRLYIVKKYLTECKAPRMMEGMTLRALLERHGIHTIREMTHRTGLSRQQCWNLWHGYAGVGRETMKRLHERLDIPLNELLEVDPIPHAQRPRRGRLPRKRPPEGGAGA